MSKVLSVRIGKKYVKICELQYASNLKSVYVNRILKAKTPPDVVEDGFIKDFFAAEAFLSAIIRENNMTATDVIFSISSGKIATKEITVPIMKEKQLTEMIEANASEYFPIYLDDYILAHNVLEKGNPKKGDNQMRVLVLAAPKELVNDYFEIANRLKLNVKSIDYAGNSAYQMIRRQIPAATSLVIQVQEETTTVNILKDNVLKLQRTIPYGKNLPIEALAERLNIDEDEAATLLETESYIHETFDGDSVTESIRPIINNVLRVVDYYNSRNSDDPVEKAYLVGESVSLLGLDFLFANEFDVSVNQLVKFNGVSLENENDLLHKIVTKYVGCLGAGLAPVNFMPKETLEKMRNANNFKWLRIGTLGALALAVIVCAIPLTKMVVAQTEQNKVQKTIDNLKGIEAVVDEYYTSYDRFNDAEGFKNLTDSNNDSLLYFIATLENKMPSDITITSFTVSGGEVSIAGKTSTKSTVAKFIQALEETTGINNVFVSALAESKDSDDVITTTFSLTCVFGKLPDDEDIITEVFELGGLSYDEIREILAGENPEMTVAEFIDELVKNYNELAGFKEDLDATANEAE